ncbi:cyclin-like protein [Mortierella sp. GBAus27b]|nr:cyclin-like protein [Mortierella sp. GBAus27b]
MAANFWTSSHSTHWILDRRRLEEAMREDLEYVDIATLTKIKMWYYNIIGKIGKRLQFRQQVIATAIVYFKRFYTKNSMRSTDPSLVAATCIYLACKIEECPQHIKHIITEMKGALGNHGGFDYDVSKVAEFEFYLLEELEFYLIVYHPYRDLTLIAKELKLEESNLQTAWFVVNDSYRTDVCLLYAPHMIALAALYIICVVHAERNTDSNGGNGGGGSGGGIAGGSGGTMGDDSSGGGGNMIASHAHSNMHLHAQLHSMATKKGGSGGHHTSEGHGINNRNMVQWFAELNVDIEEIIEITQEMLSLYTIWKDYNEESIPAMVQSLKRSIMPASPQQQQQQQPSQQQPSQQSQQYQQQGIQQ